MAAADLEIELSPSNFQICEPQCEPTGVIGAGASEPVPVFLVTGGPTTQNTCSVTSSKDEAMTNSQ